MLPTGVPIVKTYQGEYFQALDKMMNGPGMERGQMAGVFLGGGHGGTCRVGSGRILMFSDCHSEGTCLGGTEKREWQYS